MRKLMVAAVATALALAPLTGAAFADNGRGNGGHGHGGHGAEQGAKPNKERPAAHTRGAHARGGEHADAGVRADQHARGHDEDATPGPEDEGDAGKVGICHATGNGSYVFIRVSENARHGHLDRHADDVEVAEAADCPETVADTD